MGDRVKPVPQTYFEISDVKHTKVKDPPDYTQVAFTYLKNEFTHEVLEPVKVDQLEKIISEYKNNPRGKTYDRCLFKGGYSGVDCYQSAPYLFFDIDVKDNEKKKENLHLFDPEANEAIFKELQKVAVICWRSRSKNGIAGVLYVPQIAEYLNDKRELHKLAGEAITEHLSRYLHEVTGIPSVSFDDAQSKFRQVRNLATQTKSRKLNRHPFEFSYKVEQKTKEHSPGVTAYRPHDHREVQGTIYSQYNANNDILTVAQKCGFDIIGNATDNKVRVKHPDTTSTSSGVIDQVLNIFFNYSGSLSKYKSFTPAQMLCTFEYNNDWGAFRRYLRNEGYKEKAKDEKEIKKAASSLKADLEKVTDHKKAAKIIFSHCFDLQTLEPHQKQKFITDNCPRPELEKYFVAYLNLVDHKIHYDKRLTIKKYVSEVMPEILEYADQHQKIILKAETGFGKTTAFVREFHTQRPGKRLLVLEPLTVIIKQNKKEYSERAIFLDGNSAPSEFEAAEYEDLVFATYEQGTKLMARSEFDYIIIDEVHQLLTANSYKRQTIAELTGAITGTQTALIGLTGTPTNIFKKIGYKLIEVDVKNPDPVKVEVRYSNQQAYNIALSHLRSTTGKTLLRLNDIEGLKALKKQLVACKLYKESEISIFYSNKELKISDEYLRLSYNRKFNEKTRLVLTTSLIDEGLSIDQIGFTDIVFIETSYSPRPEAPKQFFARFRNVDSKRRNYLYLRKKDDQTPRRFNPDWAYNDTFKGLHSAADERGENEVKSTLNAVFSNDPFYYIDNEINPYFLAYSVTESFFYSLNADQYLNFLETNYNIKFTVNEDFDFDPGEVSMEKHHRKEVKKRIAEYWINAKDEVMQLLVIHTQSTTIRRELSAQQAAIQPQMEVFVIDKIKAFEKLYKRSAQLKMLGADDPDDILIDKAEMTLSSEAHFKKEVTLFKINKMIFEPQNEADKIAAERINMFVDWCQDKGEFTPDQMFRKLKKLRVYKYSDYTFKTIQNILIWFDLSANKNTKTKLIKVTPF